MNTRNQNAMPKRCIILTRVSSEGQSDNTSPETQEEGCRRRALSEGWHIVSVYNEVESGRLYNFRGQTQAALKDLEDDKADVLLFYDLSRYGRDVEYQHKMLKRVTRLRKQIQFSTIPLLYDEETGDLTPESEILFNNMGSMSSVERAMIRRRMMVGRLKAVSQGRQISCAMSPFGYHIVSHTDILRGLYKAEQVHSYILVEEEAQHVRRMFELFDAGHSLRALCRDLRDRSIATKRGARSWLPSTVRFMLKNPVYKGQAAYGRNKHIVDDDRKERGLNKGYNVKRAAELWHYIEAPAVVSAELWDRCNQRLDTAQSVHSGRRDRKWMLSGLLRCPKCERSMSGRTTRPGKTRTSQIATRQYRCGSRISEGYTNESCGGSYLRADDIERAVVECFLHIARAPETLEAAYLHSEAARRKGYDAGEHKEIERELKEVEKRERIAAEAKIEARVRGQNPAAFDAMLDEASEKRQRLGARLEALKSVQTAQPVEPRTAFWRAMLIDMETVLLATEEEVPAAAKHQMLSRVVRRIHPTDGGIEIDMIDASGSVIKVVNAAGQIDVKVMP